MTLSGGPSLDQNRKDDSGILLVVCMFACIGVGMTVVWVCELVKGWLG